jgi:hypothetical protein
MIGRLEKRVRGKPGRDAGDTPRIRNALTPDGGEQLVRMLMRTRKAGEWQIVLKGGSVDSPCVINNAAPEGCFIVEPSSIVNIGYMNFFKTLTLEAQGLGAQSRQSCMAL